MQRLSLMVLDGEMRSTLGIVRSLGGIGIPITVGSNNPLGRSNFSRNVKSYFIYPADNSEAAHDVIVNEIKKQNPDILMPIFDNGWSIVFSHYEEYESMTRIVPNPGGKLFKHLLDKAHLADTAEKYGVPIPKTYRPVSIGETRSLSTGLPYPVLLKPRISNSGEGIMAVSTADELLAALGRMKEMHVIQEYIEGEDLELTILCDHGEPIAGATYLSLRNAPLPYGPPVACLSIKDDILMSIGKDFLKKIGYHGVAHLDFRRDRRDGQLKLLDFNARLAGTNEISTVTGIDFAHLQYLMAAGRTIKPCFEFELGKEFRWIFPGELRHLAQTPDKWKTIKNLIKWKNIKMDISITDPMPHLSMVLDGIRKGRLGMKLSKK